MDRADENRYCNVAAEALLLNNDILYKRATPPFDEAGCQCS
jgi:hypothetical protein